MYQKQRIRTLCLCCKEAIDKNQSINGKAFCHYCETMIFDTPPVGYHERTLTMNEFIEQQQKREAEIFIKIVQRILNKIS